MWNNSLLKGPEDWMIRASITKDEKLASRWKGETETSSHDGGGGREMRPNNGDPSYTVGGMPVAQPPWKTMMMPQKIKNRITI